VELSTPATEGRHCPLLSAILRRVGLSLLIACVVPGCLFFVCFRVDGVWTAILAALGWSYGALAFRAVTGRRTSGLLVLTALVMTGRTLIALATGSTFLYFLQPVVSDGLVGTTFLLSLATARPVVARLAGDFYPMDHELSMRPRVQRLFRRLTVLWAVLCLAKATMTLWLLQTTSLDTFVTIKSISVPTINSLAAAATIAAAVAVARKEGLLAPASR
jgi:intracellular septation protein A